MGVFALVLAELRHRWMQSLMTVLAVSVAVGIATAASLALTAYDRAAEAAAATKERETLVAMERLQDEVRQAALRLGFNLLILPADQPLAEVFGDGSGSRTMPEEHARRLAARKPDTVNHLLPALQRWLAWPERQQRILLIGVLGEVWIKSSRQQPLQHAVAAGECVLGAEVAQRLQLALGAEIVLCGERLRVAGIQPGRGSNEDTAVFVHLTLAQRLLGEPGRIGVIYGLECECGSDALTAARREIAAVLPDVQVVELSRIAAARDQTRKQAAAVAEAAAARERAARSEGRALRAGVAQALVPAAAIAALAMVALLAWLNVRERRAEIGVLRAVGRGGSGIAGLFMLRALLLGLLGGTLGLIAGILVALPLLPGSLDLRLAVSLAWLVPVAMAAATLAAAGPALVAANRDPSEVLRD